MEVIPQIKDISKRAGLIQTTLPVLDHALDELVVQLGKTKAKKGKIENIIQMKKTLHQTAHVPHKGASKSNKSVD